jgi:hypothetical protein
MTRAPYADQPAVIREFCSCVCDDEGQREVFLIPEGPDGALARVTLTDPKCPLHGDDAERSPF